MLSFKLGAFLPSAVGVRIRSRSTSARPQHRQHQALGARDARAGARVSAIHPLLSVSLDTRMDRSRPKPDTQPSRREWLFLPLSRPNCLIISYCIFWNR